MEFIEVLKIILLGIVEGITEWLPISSTGHMKLVNYYLPLQIETPYFAEMFEYVIQLAAILAVIVLFWGKLFPLGKASENNENDKKIVWKTESLTLWLKVIVACIPAVLALAVDILFENLTEETETLIIALMLIVYGVVFILVEKYNKNQPKIQETAEISYKYAFFIGCFQLLAAIPGTSRSGVTIIGALLLGVSRTAAAEFTFFLAIPTMVGASGYKLLKFFLEAGSMSGAEIGYLLIGSVVAFAVSLCAIKFLMDFVKKHDFKAFGWYRIALGFVVIATMVVPSLIN
ncbi:MAG: undecaprenyl-diphosphate phosphatase [Clostridiales bacterium]|jgi:undecaprenyl-diphosphatase|nr:undecaprenyl-diphosphate phosphatase [Clostridiales bacterium]